MQSTSAGYATESMYRQRWGLIKPLITADKFTVIDWGSDSGWFSVSMALTFPDADVISVDGSVMLGSSNIQNHRARIKVEKLQNDTLIDSLFDAATFSDLKQTPVHYQLALSVFHWMGDGVGRSLRTSRDWELAFLDLIQCAEVTFFEVPNENNPNETPHRIRSWYGQRSVTDAITDAIEQLEQKPEIRLLGEIDHGSKGYRKLFYIRSGVRAIAPERSPDIVQVIRQAGRRIRLPLSLIVRLKIRQFKELLFASQIKT